MTRAALAALVLLSACGDGGDEMDPERTLPHALLSQYGFFVGDGRTQEPVAGVVKYDVAAELFADFSAKHRFVVLPAGGRITYRADQTWTFPVGTMIVKTFAYGARLIETRVLILREEGWLPTTYLWNGEQTDAALQLVGARVPVTAVDEEGTEIALEYRVPNQNQCYGCHGSPGRTDVLGLRTRQMNRAFDHGNGPVNQIDRFAELGMFASAPPPAAERSALPDPHGDAPLEARARAWLEANCAHCHSPGAAAGSTNLYLASDVTAPRDYGICRIPNAAGPGAGGRRYDILPGRPDESVMTFRIAATDPSIKMPEMPIQLVDRRGVALVTAWIAAMPDTGCN